MPRKTDELKIFTGGSNHELAGSICSYLDVPLGQIDIKRFPDGEIWAKVKENVRGTDVFLVQSTNHPVNENLMELLIMIDAFRRSSAKRITAVIPYFGYARQDRKDQPRVPITAKLVANLLTTAGANRILTMDLHAPQVQGFFDIPVDHLLAEPVLVDYYRKKNIKNALVACTDVGGAKMALNFSQRLNTNMAVVDKKRKGPSEVEPLVLIGDVKGKNIIIPDDIISAGGTLAEAAKFLKNRGAGDIYACCTHACFCGNAVERLKNAPLAEVLVTDTIQLRRDQVPPRVKTVSVARLFGEAILSIHNETSVSKLFV